MSNIPIETFFQAAEEEQSDFNLKELFYDYLAYWKWFLLSIVIALLLAFVFLKLQTPIYNIEGSILIKDDNKSVGGEDDMMKQLDIFSSTKVVDNEIEILKSFELMKKVVSDLHLNITYSYRGNFRNIELYKNSPIALQILKANELIYKKPLKLNLLNNETAELNGTKIPLNKEVNTEYGLLKLTLTNKSSNLKSININISPVDMVVEDLMNRLKIEASSKMSSVLLMNIEDSVPQKGQDILNKLIEAYNQAGLEDKNKVASNTLVFINERLKLIAGELSEVEKNVQDFKSREGITDISEDSKLFLENVQQNDTQLNQVKIQQSVLQSMEQYVRNSNNNSGTVPSTLGVEDPTLLGLIESLSKLEGQRQSTAKLVKPGNPIMQALDDQANALKRDIFSNIQNIKKSLSITRQKLESQNNNMKGIIKTIPHKERALVDITRQQVIKNNLYTYLLQKREETALSYASAVSDSRIVDSARSTSKPIQPVKPKIYLLFALLGIGLPIGVISIKDLLNDKIKSRKDIEKATKMPILAEISQTKESTELTLNPQGRTAVAEQIRALRTNLSFLSPGKKLQTIMFTSSLSGEGKSFISLNLGGSLAMMGKKTLILELDLRKPKLHTALNIDNSNGLSNYLIGQADLEKIVRPIPGQENYYIISSGPIPPNPVELIISSRMEELFTALKAEFDYIIIDAPPVGIVTDAQVLEQYADATIYVFRHDYTPKERLKYVDTLYREKKFKSMNAVFNGIKEGSRYGYSNGYGYYEEHKK